MTSDALKALTKAKTAVLKRQEKAIEEIGKKLEQLQKVESEMERMAYGVWLVSVPGRSDLQERDPKEKPEYKAAEKRKRAIMEDIRKAGSLQETNEAQELRALADKIGEDAAEKAKKAVFCAVADLEDVLQEYLDDIDKVSEAVRIAGSDFAPDGREVPTSYSYMMPDDILGKISELRATRFYREALAAGRGEA